MAPSMEVDAGEEKLSAEKLFLDAESGDAAAFSSLSPADLAAALSLRNESGRSILHVAAVCGNLKVVTALLAAGNEAALKAVNWKDAVGLAPIHSAASYDRIQIVKILLDNGADVNMTTAERRTALHYTDSCTVAEKLIASGAKLNKKDKSGWTPLHMAAINGNAALCRCLVQKGADLDAVDKKGQSPLMLAILSESKEVGLLLVRLGADVDICDKAGRTAISLAPNEFRPLLVDAAKEALDSPW